MSNYPLSYRLTWLPRFLRPSLRGDRSGFHVAPRRAPEKPDDAVRLVFAGDLSAVANRGLPRIDEELQALFRGADLTILNCESPVVTRVAAPLGTFLGIRHAMSVGFLSDAMGAAAIEPGRAVLSLANNHALDQGHVGFEASREAIAGLGAHTIGLTAHEKPPKIAAGGFTVSFDAFSRWHNAPREEFAARVRTAPHPNDKSDMDDDGDGAADLHCAVPHWDWEFRHFPRAETRATARRLVADGARLVVGHHSHVIQPVERVEDSLVAYGLGDFLGTAWSRTRWPLRIGALLVVDLCRVGPGRGRILNHALVPFARMRSGPHEELLPIDQLPRDLRHKVMARVDAVLGAER